MDVNSIVGWLGTHWVIIAIIMTVAINILNAATKHWSAHSGAVRILLFIAEALSIIRSRGVDGWGKLPLESVPPPGDRSVPPLVLFGLFFVLACSGCKTTAAANVERSLYGLQLASTLTLSAFHAVCDNKAFACGRTLQPTSTTSTATSLPVATSQPKCPALIECRAARRQVVKAFLLAGDALKLINKVLWQYNLAGVK